MASVLKLKDLMRQVQLLIAKRHSLEKDLKDVSFDMSLTFPQALGDSSALNEGQILTKKLNEIYGPLCKQVSTSIKEQEMILAEVEQVNRQFCMEKSNNVSGAEQKTMLKFLADADDIFWNLHSNVQENIKLYNDLTLLLLHLQEKVSDFVRARKMEEQDLVEDLVEDMRQTIKNQLTYDTWDLDL